MSADPMELVCMLYQHAIDAVGDARRNLERGDIAGRGKAISKAIGILGELTSSLNKEAGGALSSSLEQLYSYMTVRLTEANIRKQDGPLAEVQNLLATLSQAWEETRKRQTAPPVPPAVPANPAWQNASMEPVAHGWSA
jgi:flagellar secretion chaperone FliS